MNILSVKSGYSSLFKNRAVRNQGFTLVELLVTMGIITTLATLIFVSLDPISRFAEARNSRRLTDVNSILTAIHEYIIDNDGTLPAGITTSPKQLGTCISGGGTDCVGAAAACLNLSTDLSRYFKSIPLDPQNGTDATTNYAVWIDTNNIVTVAACSAELAETVEVSR